MDLTQKDQLVSYLKSEGLWAKKGLGQNFLVDKNALDKIVEAAEIKDDDLVIEVGPGTGVLTRELVGSAGKVIAVEMDEKLAGLLEHQLCHPERSEVSSEHIRQAQCKLRERAASPRFFADAQNDKFRIIQGDVLKVNLDEIIGSRKYKVVANIPYYITSKILELFLTRENKPESIVLLVQKEVAERICAKAGGMSTLSVSVQLYGEPEIVGIVQANSFFPAPKVDSAILKIVIARNEETKHSKDRHALLAMTKEQEKSFFRLIHIGFASRRKTLANNLSAGYRIDKEAANDIIKRTGLPENVRAQELSIEDWKKLVQIISH